MRPNCARSSSWGKSHFTPVARTECHLTATIEVYKPGPFGAYVWMSAGTSADTAWCD